MRRFSNRRASRSLILLAAIALITFLLALVPGAAGAKTVWLCKPGLAANPCAPGFKTSLYSPSGTFLGTEQPKPSKRRADCFYVYPTVSDQPTPNANRTIDPEVRSIALYQAARYSLHCRVFAPVYRQLTLAAILGGAEDVTPAQRALAYNDVLEAWRTYLEKYNKGRGVVLIGHSQGSFTLRRLVSDQIDPNPKLRKRLISALLLGGNVEVAKGRKVGGDFDHVPGCRSSSQLGCVVGFSTFNATPPAGAVFGKVGGALSPGDPSKTDILCTNPAALGGGAAKLDSVFPTEPFAPGTIGSATSLVGALVPAAPTPWFEFRGAYRGVCSGAGGAHVLQATPLGGAPTLTPIPDATWGLHLLDGNIASATSPTSSASRSPPTSASTPR